MHGPLQYGGIYILKHSALQDQRGFHYLIQSMRWGEIIANDIITAFDAYQLASGFVTNVTMIPQINYLNFG